jgi:aminoglycoside phosphotransferase (APT) family kinase protein
MFRNPKDSTIPTPHPLEEIDLFKERLVKFALLVHGIRNPSNKDRTTCEIQYMEDHWSYNIVYHFVFSDGVSWQIRIPFFNGKGWYEGPVTRFLENEVATMNHLRQHTTIPIPEIIAWDPTATDVGAPYILMELVPGLSVLDLWFKEDGHTPLEERRKRLLDETVAYMSQLNRFSFSNIGSLCPSRPECSTSPFNVYDVQNQEDAINDSARDNFVYTRLGPFTASWNYLRALQGAQRVPWSDAEERRLYNLGAYRMLSMMIECLPPSAQPGDTLETFVLTHPTLDAQNILAREDGTIVAFMDWDNVHTVPRWVGCERYPAWIARDWDRMTFQAEERLENTADELAGFRRYYAQEMARLRPQGQIDFTSKSNLHRAVWLAASNVTYHFGTILELFYFVFPGNDDSDLYRKTVDAIATGTLTEGDTEMMYHAFRRAFAIEGLS